MSSSRVHTVSFLAVCVLLFLPTLSALESCRCMPEDDCWPTPDDWSQFNSSIGGKLIATTPLALPCHDPNYNATECRYLQENWLKPELQYAPTEISMTWWNWNLTEMLASDGSPSSIMAPAVANLTCDAFTPATKPCTLGNMVTYSVNASTPLDISRTIAYAKEKNIRLVIRNTGHEYVAEISCSAPCPA